LIETTKKMFSRQKRNFRSQASEIRATHSDFVSFATVANVIKHKPMLLLISQFKFVKKKTLID